MKCCVFLIFLMTVLRCVTLKVRPYQTQNLGERRISGEMAEQTNIQTEHNYCYRLLACPVHHMYFESEIRLRHKL